MRRGGLGLTGAVRAFMSAGMINPVINLSRTAERVRPIGTADRQRARSSAMRMLQATSGALSITAAAAYGVSYLVPQEPVYVGAGHRRSSLLDAGRELAKQRFQCGDLRRREAAASMRLRCERSSAGGTLEEQLRSAARV